MRLYFIRHGQSSNNALWDATGASDGRSEDPDLTEIGKQQAAALAEFIRAKDAQADGKAPAAHRDTFGFTHLYSSLMVRAVRTATALSEAIRVPLVAWPEIHETGGIYLKDRQSGTYHGQPGKTRSFFQNNFPQLVLPEALNAGGWWNRPSETEAEWLPRAKGVLHSLVERHAGTDDRVAIISHGGFYQLLIREIFEMKGSKGGFFLFNTGITRLDFSPDGLADLIYHNRTDHLPGALIT
jgi:2,3-bisphosphoglycerate-dependent phosphoglycerate mutase